MPTATSSVQFYDNGVALGSPVNLTGDGFFASLAVPSLSPGTHVYTVKYLGDSFYSAYTVPFSATVVNGAPTSTIDAVISGTMKLSGNLKIQ